MLNRLIFIVVIISLPCLSAAADDIEKTARWYKVYWNKIYIADLKVGVYDGEIVSNIDTKGVAKSVSKYKNYTYSYFSKNGDTYAPTQFDSSLTQRQGVKKVNIKYSSEGKITEEIVTPPDNRSKRPAVLEDLKIGAVDPLFAAIVARGKIKTGLANGINKFDFNIYDGRRLSKLEFNIYGKENIKVLEKRLDVVKISFKRLPIAGFTKNELKRMKGEEPDFVVYLEDDTLLPIKADAAAPLGKALFVLEKECKNIEECR